MQKTKLLNLPIFAQVGNGEIADLDPMRTHRICPVVNRSSDVTKMFRTLQKHPWNHANIISNHLFTACPVNFTLSNKNVSAGEKGKKVKSPQQTKTVHGSSPLLSYIYLQ